MAQAENLELLNLKQRYGEFMVIMVETFIAIESGDNKGSCKPEWTGRLSPIEMALTPPFNQASALKEVKISEIKDKVLQPLPIPNRVMQDNAAPTILVAYMKSPDTFTIRANYLANHNPITSLLESLMLPIDRELTLRNYQAHVQSIFKAYLKSAKKIQNILYNREYVDSKGMFILDEDIASDESVIIKAITQKIETATVDQLYDLFNRYIAVTSSFKVMAPRAAEAPFDYYALQVLKSTNVGVDLDTFIKPTLFSLPGLVEYFKQIAVLFNTAIDGNGMQLLKMESFRVAMTADADIPKDYFTIFTTHKINQMLNYRVIDAKRVDNLADRFTAGLYKQLDLSKTCLTGSAIAFIVYVSKTWHTQGKDYDTYAQTIINLYPSIIITFGIYESKGRILDLSRKVILDPLKTVEAVFSFGADIDLAVLVTDLKEFDAIAEQHYQVCLKQWPAVQKIQNTRNEGYTYSIVSTVLDDYLLRGFRVVEIYRGSIAKILSHHVPAVRGWYDNTGLHLDITAAMLHTWYNYHGIVYDNYYYFASNKTTPSEIIAKYAKRRFGPQIDFSHGKHKTDREHNKQLIIKLIETADTIAKRDLDILLRVYGLKRDDGKARSMRNNEPIRFGDMERHAGQAAQQMAGDAERAAQHHVLNANNAPQSLQERLADARVAAQRDVRRRIAFGEAVTAEELDLID